MIERTDSDQDSAVPITVKAVRSRTKLPTIANADTFVQELNVLQLEGLLFDFSRKHSDNSVFVTEATDAAGRSVKLVFDPRYHRPGILAYRVLQRWLPAVAAQCQKFVRFMMPVELDLFVGAVLFRAK